MIASLCDEQNDVGLFGHLRSCSTGEERVDNLLYHVMRLNWKLMFFLGGEGGGRGLLGVLGMGGERASDELAMPKPPIIGCSSLHKRYAYRLQITGPRMSTNKRIR